MNSTTLSSKNLPTSVPIAARAALGALSRLQHGHITLQLPDGRTAHFGQGGGAHASMQLKSWQLFNRVLRHGDIGLAEGFIAGDWDTPDLTALLRLLLANREDLEKLVYGSWWALLWSRIKHRLNRNTRRGSARNIHAHYDLGNAFYQEWLDPALNYSSAWFQGDLDAPLPEAQQAKLRRALEQAGVKPGARLLEIGCGWGSMAQLAAQDFGAQVTGVTLSHEQLAWARDTVGSAGVGAQCDLRLQDYRDLPAEFEARPFDAVVSIEMFEAVGHAYWESYFDTLRRCLKPGGLACIQSITIRDDLFARYLKSTDFIQQYIFPGGLLPSSAEFTALAERAGFVVERSMAFGLDYAETLRRWRQRFLQRRADVLQHGFDQRFLRIWEFYLAYCEAAFLAGTTDVVQFTLRRL